MFDIFKGPRPDITPAMIAGFLLAGVPVISNLLRAFGVFDISPMEEDALKEAVQWGTLGGLGLVVGDVGLRASRNASDGKVKAAALMPVPPAAQGVAGAAIEPVVGLGAGLIPGEELIGDEDELPDDDTELSAPPPDDSNMPVQPSQVGLTAEP